MSEHTWAIGDLAAYMGERGWHFLSELPQHMTIAQITLEMQNDAYRFTETEYKGQQTIATLLESESRLQAAHAAALAENAELRKVLGELADALRFTGFRDDCEQSELSRLFKAWDAARFLLANPAARDAGAP